ncbi:MAG: hypothetical protein GYA55_11165, partial [SAR324 cluster bacterium]|nr:hypothetical protein [SAR324 cluster bacterium]
QVNGISRNPDWTPDRSVVVLETESSVPVHYLPDLLGYSDIFVYEGEVFNRISNEQLAIVDGNTGAVTLANVGGPANGDSGKPRVDASGKYVVFESLATNLVLTKDSNNNYVNKIQGKYAGYKHVYLYDRYKEQAFLISQNEEGVPGEAASENPWISDDARFIVFETKATNLIKDITTTSHKNIVVYDRVLEQFYLVTAGPNPSYTPGATPGADTRAVQGINSDATITDIAPNGLTIAYQTDASDAINSNVPNVVPDTNNKMDVFLAFNACPTDGDGDEVPDCLDLCRSDPNKHDPGQCGCDNPDTDTDVDGTADCLDECKNDPLKVVPGVCGCGLPETDTDGDGVADCIDSCKFDPSKIEEGVCGCGVSDDDTNGNGNADCNDPDPNKVPDTPIVIVVKSVAKIAAETGYTGVQYTFNLKKISTGKITVQRTRNAYWIIRRLAKGRYSIRYRISAGSISTQWSSWKNFKIR